MSFKQITVSNWADPDPTSEQFGRQSAVLAGPRSMDGPDWAREFLALDLKDQVPTEIRDLFAVARGAAVYGWFFYPLYRLGEEQLHRVVESAVKACYRQLGGTKRKPTYEQATAWLVELNVIPPADSQRWKAARALRNTTSHPTQQSVMTPGAVLGMFQTGAHDINRLFVRALQAAPH